MADSNQSSSGVGGVVGSVKADASKAASAARTGVQDVKQAQASAESWITRHAVLVVYGGMALALGLIVLAVVLLKHA